MAEQNKPTQYAAFDELLRLQFDDSTTKRRPSYGLKLAQSMWTYVAQGNNGYYETRRNQWELNRMWSKGTKDNREFMNFMGVEGNKTYLNIDYEILKIVPRWLKTTVNRYMD